MIRRRRKNRRGRLFLFCISVIACTCLLSMLFLIVCVAKNGIAAIGGGTFMNDLADGGLRNAIVGHAMITFSAMAISLPIGILSGTYIAEYGQSSKISRLYFGFSEIAVNIPPLVIAICVYAAFVLPAGRYSGWAGALAFSLVMLPSMTKVTAELLMQIPPQLREAALALGTPRYKVITKVLYRAILKSIIFWSIFTSIWIGGETVLFLFTSYTAESLSTGMSEPVATLSVTIFEKSGTGLAWAAAFIMLITMGMIHALARIFINKA